MVARVRGLVSVVVPIYNIEDYVSGCVQSILAQTYANLEILLVDDGSSDNSGAIADDFAAHDARVTVLHKQNGGLSDARNAGIDRATGEFVLCVDGDDVITPSHIADMISAARDTGAAVVVAGFRRVSLEQSRQREGLTAREPAAVVVHDASRALELLFYQSGITTSAWGKLYRSELFDGVRYPVGAIHEDLPVTYRLIAKTEHVAIVSRKTYLYVQRPASITSTKHVKKRMQAISFAQEAVDFTKTEMPHLERAARARLFMEAVFILSQAPSGRAARRVAPEAVAVLHLERLGVTADKQAPLATRVYGAMAALGVSPVYVLAALQHRASRVKQAVAR